MTTPNPNFQPTILYNLVPGQYQIGNRVIGRGTTVRMETFDVKPYDQNNQDYQIQNADEVRFGQDSLKPSTLELTFDVINNKLRPGYEDLIPNFWAEMPTVKEFANIWRNDANRFLPGSMEPLYICGKDGITRVVFGRPGQFTYTKEEVYDEYIQCLAEFRRADTLAHTAQEAVVELALSADPVYLLRQSGDGPDAWLRLILLGPLTNPVITIGTMRLQLNYTIDAGNVVEISSYPWQRRTIDANGLNLSSNLQGPNQYLDKFTLPWLVPIPLKWTSNAAATMVPALGTIKWEENIDGYSMQGLPSTFTEVNGRTIVRFDLFNFSGVASGGIFGEILGLFGLTPRKYLGPGVLGTKCACFYNDQQFTGAGQRAQAQLVNEGLWLGQSALTIMTNAAMTQLVGAMVDCEAGSNSLKIVSGSYDTLTTRATWTKTGEFSEHDHIAIEYKPTTKTYHLYYNDGTIAGGWQDVAQWADPTSIIPTGVDNRYQGFIFDAGGGLGILQGAGFCNIVAYDTLQETPEAGRVFLLWRDTWSTIG